jgi:uncharacterized protein with ParB-like and HNH nuclease domain
MGGDVGMEPKLNKIEANDRTVSELLDKKKYTIDIFQREYKWARRHVEQLLTDLTSKFFDYYDEEHSRTEVENYGCYYLGSVVLSQKGPVRFIIDGQQRLTSITLLLIYLNNLQRQQQRRTEDIVSVSDLIYSEKYGQRSYNLQIEERKDCIDTLYRGADYDIRQTKDESVLNIVDRYNDIQELFPTELGERALPYFMDWLINNVVFVEIITYADEDAYRIFETMNDRGLNLTPTEMLKGFLLSNAGTDEKKAELNKIWRENIQEVNEISTGFDDAFFKAWLRAKYAETARERRKGSENEAFEKIGTRFHSWVRENKERIGLRSSEDFYNFVKDDMQFYVRVYLMTWFAETDQQENLENVYYVGKRGFPFFFDLIIAPVKTEDNDKTIAKKMALVSRYVETYIVCRSVNYKTLGYDSIRYGMFNLMKDIRNKDVTELAQILKDKVTSSEEKLSGLVNFNLSSYYGWFVHFLLARITNHIERQSGVVSDFEKYITTGSHAPFEIEHIIADDFQAYRQEFDDSETEFQSFRSKMGNLILLPNGFNQSYGQLTYAEKLPHYFGQNLLAKTLNDRCYQNNPNFLKYASMSGLPFKPYSNFGKKEILERTLLYQKICEEIWSPEGFDAIVNR